MVVDRSRHGRREQTVPVWVWMLCTLAVLGVAAPASAQVIAGSSVYVRQDTDKTTVIAPRWHVGAPVADTTRVDFVYTADVWSSASIDIRTSASKRKVTEQRDEINTTVTQEFNDLSLSGTYRYSHEYDYRSHGGTLSGSYAMAEKSTTLDFRLGSTFDEAGRAGDETFNRSVRNLNLRLGLTQLIDQNTFIQVIYEIMDSNGFNSSSYRYVGFGTPNGLCKYTDVSPSDKTYCVPERNPSDRLKHAFALNFRRALGESFSLGVGYRFYLDSWGVASHTGTLEFSYLASSDLLLALRYRVYTQGSAKQYKKNYDYIDAQQLKVFSNDKELSSFMSHRLALDIEKEVELDERGHKLSIVLSIAPALFLYSNYAPLSQISAIETTLATVFRL
jgi:Protein of unknown function (DUF3570)